MRIPLLPLISLLLLAVSSDAYIFVMLRRRFRSLKPSGFYAIGAIALWVVLIVGLCLPMRGGSQGVLLAKMWILFGFLTFLFPKVLFVIIDLLAQIPLLLRPRRKRLRWLSVAGAVMAGVVFVSMWWGALINRFRTDTIEVDVVVESLPQAFDGYRIVQISDLHVGTYGSDDSFVREVVEKVNGLKPDMIVFTGDIVNRISAELVPFTDALSGLHAPDGVYSILGNHDYGDYYDFASETEMRANLDSLISMQRRMGWDLLLNEHRVIRRGADSLVLIGVENVGDPPFKTYGDLGKAYPATAEASCKILLTHNPAHWTDDISKTDSINIALSLAGHTHAMQIEVFGLSPAALRYATWGGLYGDGKGQRLLYVNRGIGTVGMPMRLGATPEITLITLRRK